MTQLVKFKGNPKVVLAYLGNGYSDATFKGRVIKSDGLHFRMDGNDWCRSDFEPIAEESIYEEGRQRIEEKLIELLLRLDEGETGGIGSVRFVIHKNPVQWELDGKTYITARSFADAILNYDPS